MVVSILADGTIRSNKQSAATRFVTDEWLKGQRLFQDRPIIDGYLATLPTAKVARLVEYIRR